MTWRKGSFVVFATVCFALLSANVSNAQTGACSSTHLAPGDTLSVSGSGAAPGETATLLFNSSTIGATTVDGFGNFTVSGTVPGSTTPGTYTVDVTFTTSTAFSPCSVVVEDAVATASPTPAATAAPAATFPPFPQMQQQQQQQQQVVVPAFLPAPVERTVVVRSALPTTGAAVGELAQGGTGALIIGISLVEFARRRKRNWKVAHATTTTLSEGDLLLPFWPRN